ncbi:MAG: LamG domain-containing protein [Candidatus Paceibacterota bacterium]
MNKKILKINKILPLFIFCILFGYQTVSASVVGSSMSSSNSLMSGLLGWWTFDGADMLRNVTDKSGNGNNGKLVNFTSTSSAVVAGKIGQGLKFDGSNDYVINTGSSATFNPANGITISLWLKPTTASTKTFLTKLQTGNGYYTRFTNTRLVGILDASRSWVNLNSASALPLNAWSYVTFTADSTGYNIYINGSLNNSTTTAWVQPTTANALVIGGDTNGSSYFPGTLDDVRIYNRALSANEVRRLYSLGAGTKMAVPPPVSGTSGSLSSGLVGWWTFDGPKMKNNITDSSGQGNNGSMVGFTSTSSAVILGRVGQGLKFDGSNDYVDVGSGASLDQLAEMTYSVWINPKSYGTYNIVNKGGRFSNGPLFYTTSDKAFIFQEAYTGGGYGAVSRKAELGSITVNTWIHLVATWDGTNDCTHIHLYKNGQEVPYTYCRDADIAGSRRTDSSLNMAIGSSIPVTGALFDGSIDDVRIYNRALSAVEIQQLYSMGGNKVSVSPPTSGVSGSFSSGLVGWWTFDGNKMLRNVTDSSGQGNNGSMSGFTSTSSAVILGRIGQGLKFDGSNDYINAGSASTLDDIQLQSGGVMTVAFWIKPPSNSTGAIISKGVLSNSTGHMTISKTSDTNPARLIFRKDGTTDMIVYYNSELTTGVWQHIVFSWNGSALQSGVTVYKNGLLQTQSGGTDGAGLYSDAGNNLLIGYQEGIGYTNSALDDVRIYNRALSAVEIRQLYNMGK